MNISAFDYKIFFVNLQHKNTNSKGVFLLKNVLFKDVWYIEISKKYILSVINPSIHHFLKKNFLGA
jgi:hypothetical protein